jgi:hypothetical protein
MIGRKQVIKHSTVAPQSFLMQVDLVWVILATCLKSRLKASKSKLSPHITIQQYPGHRSSKKLLLQAGDSKN